MFVMSPYFEELHLQTYRDQVWAKTLKDLNDARRSLRDPTQRSPWNRQLGFMGGEGGGKAQFGNFPRRDLGPFSGGIPLLAESVD